MFEVLRDAVIAEFEDFPCDRFYREPVAYNAAKRIFRNFMVFSCYFHFNQNLNNHYQFGNGLLQNELVFNTWLRQLKGSLFLSLDWCEEVVSHLLLNSPKVRQENVVLRTEFINYFRRQWRNKLFMLCHFDNFGLRTTDDAEEFHNAPNSIFNQSYPSFTKAYYTIRNVLADETVEYLSIDLVELPLKKPKWRLSDQRIEAAK